MNGSTPKVQYGYADGSANTIRPATLTYPDGRVLTYGYGTANDINDAASRIESIIDDDVSSTHLADYSYLGVATFFEVDYTEPGGGWRFVCGTIRPRWESSLAWSLTRLQVRSANAGLMFICAGASAKG